MNNVQVKVGLCELEVKHCGKGSFFPLHTFSSGKICLSCVSATEEVGEQSQPDRSSRAGVDDVGKRKIREEGSGR